MKASWIILLTLVLGAARAESQTAAQPTYSMGQPKRILPYGSALGLGSTEGAGIAALLGASRPIANPIVGILNVNAEGYGQLIHGSGGAGLRALATAPALGFALGVDWSATDNRADALLIFQTALRRGGVVGHGSMLRIDWLPTRHRQLGIGVNVPIAQPFAGRTRQRVTSVRPTEAPTTIARALPLGENSEHAMSAVAKSASLIAAFTNLHPSAEQDILRGSPNATRSYDDVLRSSATALANAFSSAIGDASDGTRVAEHARAIVLDAAILPYDALFGQAKDKGVLPELLAASRAKFLRWLADSTKISLDGQARALGVFDRWTNVITEVHRDQLARWHDSRLVWLPAQMALTPDQIDEQSEVDAIIGRVAGHPFTDDNELAYLRTADLPLEIARSILATRRYHVLWTHDFTSRRPSGRLDEIGYTMVADAYLPALTAAVQRYDSTGSIPEYLILLDAYYYHANHERLWMSVLENPLAAHVSLRADEADKERHLEERLEALRSAVARSARLQRDAASNGGESWLERIVKVNVNVVLPSDYSFRSSHILPPLPFTPDNIIRDHRKVVLYDFTEARPYDGELLVTGVGIGEHYASATWEDRGYRVRGPAALDARTAVRRALASNGFTTEQIPRALRAMSDDRADATDPSATLGAARALNVDNDPGFGPKRASATRALLYTLAPPGSDIVVPDPLWLSDSWTGMLLAAAARGCRVALITPAAANSPNPEATVFAAQNDVLHRALEIRRRMATQIERTGGAFRIGLFASTVPVTNVNGRLAEIRTGLARSPWIHEMIPFDSSALVSLQNAAAQADRMAAQSILAKDEQPREPLLHQKTQLIARPGAIAALLRQPGWDRALSQTIVAEAQETARFAEALAAPIAPPDTASVRATERLLDSYERSLTPAERKRLSFYFTVGSQNHDMRGLQLDGEANVIVSGFAASAGVVDLFYLMSRTTWVDTDAEIDRLLPPRGGFVARLAKLLRLVL